MSAQAYAKYELKCFPESFCNEISPTISRLLSEKDSKEEIERKVSQIEMGSMISFIEVLDEEPILIRIIRKQLVKESRVIFSHPFEEENEVVKILPSEGSYFNNDVLKNSLEKAKKRLKELGFSYVQFSTDIKEVEERKVIVAINVDNQNAEYVGEVKIQGDLISLVRDKSFLLKRFEGERLRTTLIEKSVSEIREALEEHGYLFCELKLNYHEKLSSFVKDVYLKVSLGPRIQFSLSGDTYLTQAQVKKILTDEMKNSPSQDYKNSFQLRIKDELLKKGLYQSQVKVTELLSKGLEGQVLKTYIIDIHDGFKVRVSTISFQGNSFFSDERLMELYYEKSTVIADRDYYDSEYVDNFKDILKELYLKEGFIFSQVTKPRTYFSDDQKSVEIVYTLFEGKQSILRKINISVLKDNQMSEALEGLDNKEGTPLNVVAVEQDLNKVLSNIREMGYYFARIENANEKSLISYSNDYEDSFINIDVSLGKKSYYEDVIVTGNEETQDAVITREVELQKGDIILPSTLIKLRNKLNSLGLFGGITIKPIVLDHSNDTNKIILLIHVTERDFGRGEIAPGFRSDLGAKLSFLISRKNLWGLNHSLTFQTEVNMRYTLSNLDARREAQGKDLLEGLLKTSYNWPYLLDFTDFRISASYQRRRFTGFDADIYRVAPTLYKKVNDYLSLNLEYQLEQIRQFNATETKDQATFRIGSITPGFSLDFRDNPAVPRSGAFFGLTWEFANPAFLSKDDEDIEINFHKLITRNRFYIPLWEKKFVLATSISAGVQENFADQLVYNSDGSVATNDDGSARTRGYIPSIKVFRLDGLDIVRGFSETEINRLDSGQDISNIRVQGKAYFSNIKIEPRYYINDSMVLGLFFDAGRVYLNNFEPGDMRSAVGTTIKVLTPVGTLDFDYGVKTERRTVNGTKESFGRFHLNIGYF